MNLNVRMYRGYWAICHGDRVIATFANQASALKFLEEV